MGRARSLREDALQFVTDALTQLGGQRPSRKTIAVTVKRIVKALEPAVAARRAKAETPSTSGKETAV